MLCFLAFCLFLTLQVTGGASVEETLALKYRKLIDLSHGHTVIPLNTDNFRTYVQQKPKNYTFVVLLTIKRSDSPCEPCGPAGEEFQILANSWRYTKQRTGDIFFGVVDYNESPKVFEMLHLNSAPSILLLEPTKSIEAPEYLDIAKLGFSAEVVAQWITGLTSIKIRVFRPPSYSGTIILACFMLTGAVALWYNRISLDSISNPSLWCVLSLGAIFCGISGQMYNQIRGPPLFHGKSSGELVALIYPGSDYQFVAETFIVMALYVMATVGIILIHHVDGIVEVGKKKIYLFGGVGLFTVAFSLILSVFRKKYQGYPYSFFFK